MKLSQAWDKFIGMLRAAQHGAADGCVPIACIMLPADSASDGIDIRINGQPRVLWPPSFPNEERVKILKHIAMAYGADTVIQTRQEAPDG